MHRSSSIYFQVVHFLISCVIPVSPWAFVSSSTKGAMEEADSFDHLALTEWVIGETFRTLGATLTRQFRTQYIALLP